MAQIVQSTEYVKTFFMALSQDGKSPATGKTVSALILKNAGSLAAPVGTISEVSNGLYALTLAKADTDTRGSLSYEFSAPDCDITTLTDQVVAPPLFSATHDFTLTRDQIIYRAYRALRVIEDGEPLSPSLQEEGVQELNSLVRAMSDERTFNHTVVTSTLPLTAYGFSYNELSSLPTNMVHLLEARYRDSNGQDWPVTVVNRKGWEDVRNKTSTGDPAFIFLTDELSYRARTLFVTPMLGTVNAQSEVLGSDGLNYRCIRNHVASSENQPITGASYPLYWEQGGTAGVAWVTGTTYTAPQQLRLTYEIPLADLDTSDATLNLPQSYDVLMKYRLAEALGPANGASPGDLAFFNTKATQEMGRIFKKTIQKPQSRQYHATYY